MDSLTPEDILPQTAEIIKQEFPEPFRKYKSHLPKRTPFSILLDIVTYWFIYMFWISGLCNYSLKIRKKYIANVLLLVNIILI